jgi:SAM-dependent methyltransferase
MKRSPYDSLFYEDQKGGSYNSAQQVVPYLIRFLQPASILDVGCGVGTWLKVFLEHKVEDVVGVDGEYVDRSQLLIPSEKFVVADLTQGLDLKRQFDLVVSLEVAEHLPTASSSLLVETLAAHGRVVMFSAAVPGQGGTDHINEQWPDYWKRLFEARGYSLVDCLRAKFWNDKKIVPTYRQNMVLYVDRNWLAGKPELQEEYERGRNFPLPLVHPDVFAEVLNRPPGLRKLLQALPHAISETVRIRVGRLAGRVLVCF